MRYAGNVLINAPSESVWAMLLNPYELSQCMPGLTSWRVVTPQQAFQLYIAWSVTDAGQIEFPVLLEWVRLDHNSHMQLNASATVGSSTHISANGAITLTAVSPTQTDLAFSATVVTPNKIMDRLVHTAVPKLTAAFFQCFKNRLAPPG